MFNEQFFILHDVLNGASSLNSCGPNYSSIIGKEMGKSTSSSHHSHYVARSEPNYLNSHQVPPQLHYWLLGLGRC